MSVSWQGMKKKRWVRKLTTDKPNNLSGRCTRDEILEQQPVGKLRINTRENILNESEHLPLIRTDPEGSTMICATVFCFFKRRKRYSDVIHHERKEWQFVIDICC